MRCALKRGNKVLKLLNPTKNKGILFLFALILMVAASCSPNRSYSGENEGRIIYDVTYPYETPSLVLDLYPKELHFYFKEDMMCSELKSSYDLISSHMIIDNDRHRFIQMLKNMRERNYVSLKEKETRTWLNMHPDLRYVETNEFVVIVGKKCKKVLAYLPDESVPPLELYYTNDMDLSTNNWWNQFFMIDGFLLGYDLEAFGKRMRVRAREIIHEPVNELRFKVPENYIEVNAEQMQSKLQEIMEEFVQK